MIDIGPGETIPGPSDPGNSQWAGIMPPVPGISNLLIRPGTFLGSLVENYGRAGR
jgi:hypothetical protein